MTIHDPTTPTRGGTLVAPANIHAIRTARDAALAQMKHAAAAFQETFINELTDMLRAARITTETWHEFLDGFVQDAELVARIRAQSSR